MSASLGRKRNIPPPYSAVEGGIEGFISRGSAIVEELRVGMTVITQEEGSRRAAWRSGRIMKKRKKASGKKERQEKMSLVSRHS